MFKDVKSRFRWFIKSLIKEIIKDYFSENQEEFKTISRRKYDTEHKTGKLLSALKMHSRNFNSLSMHFDYISEFGTDESFKINSLQEILKFEINDTNDKIYSVKALTLFIRSFNLKERITCVNMIPYGAEVTVSTAEVILKHIKDDIKQFPELLLMTKVSGKKGKK